MALRLVKDQFGATRRDQGGVKRMAVPGDRTVFGGNSELRSADRMDFTDCASVLSVGGATLIEIRGASGQARCTEEDIAGSPADALCIYQQRDSGGWFDAGGARFVVGAGAFASNSSDLPCATRPGTDTGCHLRIVKIPLARCKALIGHEQDLAARALTIAPGPTALFASYFESFVEQAPHLTGAGAEAAVQTLAQLAIVARGLAEPQAGGRRDAGRAGLLQHARQTIENNIHRSDLSPAVIAGLLGISVRQLHLLFEPTGITYARYALSRRLDHARVLLAQTSKRPVADIAYACGFDGLSTFYRSFRATFGMSPADFRESVRNSVGVHPSAI